MRCCNWQSGVAMRRGDPAQKQRKQQRAMVTGSTHEQRVVAIGEVLWDALPSGLFLGGAPLNVACHLQQLGADVQFASRVGDDELGREIARRFPRKGIEPSLLQVDSELPTGFVIVQLDDEGKPTYEIKQPSAWDNIQPTDALVESARGSTLVYGSLAQRELSSRSTILRLKEVANRCVFDVNLRPPFVYKEVVERAADGVWLLKISDEEMPQMQEWFGLEGLEGEELAQALKKQLKAQNVVLTFGKDGAALLNEHGEYSTHDGYNVNAIDTVGAGDAFLATVLWELMSGTAGKDAVEIANAVGAWVTMQSGATPTYTQSEVLKEIREGA